MIGSETPPTPAARVKPLAVLLCALAALVVGLVPWSLEPPARAALVVLVAIGSLWMTEAVPLAVSALLVPVLATALGAATVREAFAGFGHPIVFLFLGTFLLTEAASRHGLDRRLAEAVMTSEWVRAKPRRLLFAIAFLGCAISAWVNNTATTALLLPLALTSTRLGSTPFVTSVLLMTAYAPTLGGIATPVGTAPNLIGRGLIEAHTGSAIPFARWCLLFAPLAVLFTIATAAWLAWCGGRVTLRDPPGPARASVPWSRAEQTLVVVFAAVIALWITPGLLAATELRDAPWLSFWKARFPEECVPLVGGILLFLLPSGLGDGTRISAPLAFRRVDWSTILLFGGGMSLGAMLERTGLAQALGTAMFDAMPLQGAFGVTLAATLMAVIVSEFASNTASATLVIPIVLALATAAGIDPIGPGLAATIGCSFGFMLPVSTPPNALVYGTGLLKIPDMVRRGLLLDVTGAVVVATWITLWL